MDSRLTDWYGWRMTIKEYLASQSLTAKAFAERVGVSRQSVSNWLSGDCIPQARHHDPIRRASGYEITIDGILEPLRRTQKR